MKLRPLSAALLLALSSMTLAVQADDVRRPYVVQLADKPIASYDGAVAGLAATQPRAGQRLDLNTQSVQLYNGYLDQKKAVVRSSVANAPVLHDYSVVLNGFTAMLTDAEVRTLIGRSDVVAVTPDTPRELTTTYTHSFLGLDKPDGLWAQLGGKGAAGEDIIIGIVDGGVWPEHLSYADRVDSNGKPTFDNNGSVAYDAPPSRWKGDCQTGNGFTAANCNNKLVGAQYFNTSFKASGRTPHWTEFTDSPRDSIGGNIGEGGHGTHTSTTAGGNFGVDVTMGGVNVGAMSGVAPRARISSYKVCWTYVDTSIAAGQRNGCFTGDSVAAIEKAVTDGVHVINFSISGGTSITDPVEQAFFNAANAGVLAVASAGNDGPGNQVAHISPWHATIGASTHNRELQADVVLSNGQRFTGASMNAAPLPNAPLILAEAAGMDGADPTRVALCYSAAENGGRAVLDPNKVKGKIVVCTRGTNARVDKSLAVAQAGGVGMIQVDNGTGLVAEVHSVPTVHVTAEQGAVIRAYVRANGNASASMTKFVIGTSAVKAPIMANFSSRGPNRYDANVLKPDMTAPGVDIIAGVSPEMTREQQSNLINGTLVPDVAFASYQGTSMSAPHVTGLTALLRQEHPTWTPAMVKSAMMTTATDTFPDALTGDIRGILPFAQGAGHINPNKAVDPGLVYDIDPADYRKYMCGAGIASQCAGGQIAGYELNLPSIAVGNVLGAQTVTRTVTNVGGAEATYRVSTAPMDGFKVVVSPATLTIPAGASASYTVTLTRDGAAENVWKYGSLTWSDGAHSVRSPIVARSGKPLIAPAFISSDKASGSKSMSITTGFDGKMSAAVGGLKEIVRTSATINPAPAGTITTVETMRAACVTGAPGVNVIPVTFTSSTMAAQFETFSRDTSGEGRDDLDMVLVNSAGTLVTYSANDGADEWITLAAPAPGNYRLCVIGYSTANNQPATYGFHSAIVTTSDKGGNFKALVPAKVYAGGKATIPVSWAGLASNKRYLGAVRLLDNNNAVGATTVVQVETNQPIPVADRGQRAKAKDTGI
ncbi:S8 family peptidase [Massilia sp.]|uniref:S8 family peptidase n=1 Tax=Massilia sp. TaxID=1882437 RepID=UPI00289A8674|nr:S8 family peptidase [Massilia sp.]